MQLSSRSKIGLFFSLVILFSIAGAFLLNAAFKPHSSEAANVPSTFKFNLALSPGISSCLPKAQGDAVITRGKLNDSMMVEVHGLAPNTGYDLFVIEIPNKPFGISWYQSDLQTDKNGNGQVTVRGILNVEDRKSVV